MANECFKSVRHCLHLTPGIVFRLFLMMADYINLTFMICVLKVLLGRLPTFPLVAQVPFLIDETISFTGGLADVYQGSRSGERIAVKRLRINQGNQNLVFRAFLHEVRIMDKVQHPHILGVRGIVFIDGFTPCILLPWMNNGTVVQYLKAFPSISRLPLIQDTVSALCYLKSVGIVHGDIKGTNVLVSDAGRALLSDFGHARFFGPSTGSCFWHNVGLNTTSEFFVDERAEGSNRWGGTAQWMAPELHCPEKWGLRHSVATFASDVFSLGMLIYEIYTGHIPFFEHPTPFMAIIKIVQGHHPSSASIPSGLRPLVEGCWEHNPESRPSIKHIQNVLSASRHLLESL